MTTLRTTSVAALVLLSTLMPDVERPAEAVDAGATTNTTRPATRSATTATRRLRTPDLGRFLMAADICFSLCG